MLKKHKQRIRRHRRVRKKISGSSERPRLCVRRSLKNLFIQIIDDVKSETLFSFSTINKAFRKAAGKTNKVGLSEKLGSHYAAELKKKGITKISFDRGGYQYHGRIKAFAESLRQAGIEF